MWQFPCLLILQPYVRSIAASLVFILVCLGFYFTLSGKMYRTSESRGTRNNTELVKTILCYLLWLVSMGKHQSLIMLTSLQADIVSQSNKMSQMKYAVSEHLTDTFSNILGLSIYINEQHFLIVLIKNSQCCSTSRIQFG